MIQKKTNQIKLSLSTTKMKVWFTKTFKLILKLTKENHSKCLKANRQV